MNNSFADSFGYIKSENQECYKIGYSCKSNTAIGDRTFVETIVAFELAESWNPLTKSKIRTRAIKKHKNVIRNYSWS